MLETTLCRMEYTIAKKHPLIGQQSNLLTTCEQLPAAGSPDAANCLRLGVPNVVQVVPGKSRVQNVQRKTSVIDLGHLLRGAVRARLIDLSRTLMSSCCPSKTIASPFNHSSYSRVSFPFARLPTSFSCTRARTTHTQSTHVTTGTARTTGAPRIARHRAPSAALGHNKSSTEQLTTRRSSAAIITVAIRAAWNFSPGALTTK